MPPASVVVRISGWGRSGRQRFGKQVKSRVRTGRKCCGKDGQTVVRTARQLGASRREKTWSRCKCNRIVATHPFRVASKPLIYIQKTS